MDTLNAAELLAALGHESRLAIFRLLVEAGPEGINPGAIGEQLGMAPATLSFHLAHLSRVGLIRGQRESRFIHYSTEYGMMDDLIAFLTNNCCQGNACLPKTAAVDTIKKGATADLHPNPGANEFAPAPHIDRSPMKTLKTVLVLCTGNSCRSQMGEAILNHDLAGQVRAVSAGTRPQPKVADGAIEALKLAGLPTDCLYPKDVDSLLDESIDLVVSVCDNAKETCPVFPRPVQRLHLPFHDPHGEPLESFIAVRDDIRARMVPAVRAALGL